MPSHFAPAALFRKAPASLYTTRLPASLFVNAVSVSLKNIEWRRLEDLIDEMLGELEEVDDVTETIVEAVAETKLEDLINEMLAEWEEMAKEREQRERCTMNETCDNDDASLCVAKHAVRFAIDSQVFGYDDSVGMHENFTEES